MNIMQIKKDINFKLVNTLSEALIVRRLRNECRTSLTNYTRHISILRQIYWYFSYYRRAVHTNVYRLFIARNNEDVPIGYGALHTQGKQLSVTECVAPEYRRQGYGSAILKNLISIAKKEKLPLVAEIWATNKNSIALHTRCGFVLKTTKIKSGASLCVYRKDK
ncbi:MAG: GNAT family N-acetyltransferase [bacterium]|nr:GNAT family N-acetyltransferase [bacterium]